ncbi:hypothetical protein ABWH74_004296 [Burkholderia vietnamiensis]|uniref:hypothetical protein n=1 Tax=Burkholderia vietnamiensis TaxID=60552 RepID=UPI000841F557|nr:hypothetical protein [Burkholderia vietnamiensis]AOJ99904.1 hypothetical protein WK23_15405 [Burkholderia vietnamiensis]MBR8085206.1 hypothetical protein [Burkholderia vietnamiensis]HDR9033772.1 hypothetical protein [Burkholderia vietnamiensis]
MADEIQHAEKPAPEIPDNVFEMEAYRNEKRRKTRGAQLPIERGRSGFDVEAHLFVNVCSDGETRFGVVGADGDNAICLLEPIFILGQQLVQLTDN